MNAPTVKRLRYLNLEISEKGLSEFRGNRRSVFISREEVRKLEIKFGSSAERPTLQVIAGLLLIGLGLVGLAMIQGSGLRGLRWGAGFLVFGGLGVWMLYETMAKKHFLQVTCYQGARKLIIHGKFREAEFSKFIQDATELGYDFEYSTPSTGH